jgi:hypothetical protein
MFSHRGKPAARLANGTSEMTAFVHEVVAVTSTRSAMSSSAFANFVRLGLSPGWSSRIQRETTSDGSAGSRGDRRADGHDDDRHRAPDRTQQRAAGHRLLKTDHAATPCRLEEWAHRVLLFPISL